MRPRVPYRRSRFATELPAECRYTRAHCWVRDEGRGIWRIGLTGLAVWLMGDPVEFAFSALPGSAIRAGQEIGWVEGLKALHTLYSAADGEFLEEGAAISADITLLSSDPYDLGWLYRVRGQPEPGTLDVHGYIALLDNTVDEIVRARQDECGGGCEA